MVILQSMAVSSLMPEHGMNPEEVLALLDTKHAGDVQWRAGRSFSLAYSAGDEAIDLAKEAYARFSSENMLNLDAFPSLRQMQADVMSIVGALLGGGDDTVGVFTSGGTESILTAVHGAKNWGRAKGISNPELVLPTTAHAAFSKACAYFDVTAIRVPVGPDFRADPAALDASITDNTVMIVASTPAYPQGVIDPISAVSDIALARGILFHVDACMGFTLPWLEQLGELEPGTVWNFVAPGVTSMSCDMHKFGYAAKGSSVLLHRDKAIRKHQFFMTADWLGGLYGSPALLGTRSGGGLASTWAMLHYLGAEGYRRVTADALNARRTIQAGVASIDGLSVRGAPQTTLIAFGASDPAELDIYAVADLLWQRHGWYVDRQTPPDSLHCTVNAIHVETADEFVGGLSAIVNELRHDSAIKGDRTRAYGTVE
jgi:sphinganine-1-phosphate aldolase